MEVQYSTSKRSKVSLLTIRGTPDDEAFPRNMTIAYVEACGDVDWSQYPEVPNQ